MISASYIGGGVNFAAMAAKFSTPGEYVSSTVVADNFMMALLFFILMGIPALKWFQKRFGVHEETAGSKNQAEAYWKRKEMSLQDIALNIGTAFAIVAVSVKTAAFFKERFSSDGGFQFLAFILGDQFLLLTTLTILLTIAFPRYFERLRGTQEIGTYLIYLFFVVIGIPADLRIILMNAPLLLAFVFVVAMSNLLVTLAAGKLRFSARGNSLGLQRICRRSDNSGGDGDRQRLAEPRRSGYAGRDVRISDRQLCRHPLGHMVFYPGLNAKKAADSLKSLRLLL